MLTCLSVKTIINRHYIKKEGGRNCSLYPKMLLERAIPLNFVR